MRVRLYQRSVTDSLTNDFDIVDMSGDGKGWSPISYGSTGAEAPVHLDLRGVRLPCGAPPRTGSMLGRFAYPLPEDDTPSDPFEGGAATQCTRDSVTAALSGEGYVCDPLVNTPIVGSAPVLSSDQRTVYVTSSTTVYALDADTLETKWTVAVPGGIVGPVTVAGGDLRGDR